MEMGIDQWEWEGMGILIVFSHTSSSLYNLFGLCILCGTSTEVSPVTRVSSVLMYEYKFFGCEISSNT